MYILRGAFLSMTWVSISSIVVSWSEIPGIICCLFTRSGILVKNESRMFDELVSVLVGSVIIWDKPLSFTISRRRLHCCRLLADGDGAPMCRSISGRLKSPASQMWVYVLIMLEIVRDISSRYSGLVMLGGL